MQGVHRKVAKVADELFTQIHSRRIWMQQLFALHGFIRLSASMCCSYMWLWLSIRRYFCIRNENVVPKTAAAYTDAFKCTANIRSFWFSIEAAQRYNVDVDRVYWYNWYSSPYTKHHSHAHTHRNVEFKSFRWLVDERGIDNDDIGGGGWLVSLTSMRKSFWNSFGCYLWWYVSLILTLFIFVLLLFLRLHANDALYRILQIPIDYNACISTEWNTVFANNIANSFESILWMQFHYSAQ